MPPRIELHTKGPVLEAAQAMAGARINPLEGTPQAILDLSVEVVTTCSGTSSRCSPAGLRVS